MWVLGPELQFSARAASMIDGLAISPVPYRMFVVTVVYRRYPKNLEHLYHKGTVLQQESKKKKKEEPQKHHVGTEERETGDRQEGNETQFFKAAY